LAPVAKTSAFPPLAPTIKGDGWASSERKRKMRTAVGLLVAPALEVWILLLLALDLPMLRNLIMLGRLLVLVVAHRFCSIILVASIVFAMLDGCLSKTCLSWTTLTMMENHKNKKRRENMINDNIRL
jgi:hypothetical protein